MHHVTKLAIVAAIVATAPLAASARGTFLTALEQRYPNIVGTAVDDCNTCHAVSPYTSYGIALQAAGVATNAAAAIVAVEPLDSDGDGYTNAQELTAVPPSFPGDVKSVPTPTTAPAPAISLSAASLAFGTVTVGGSAAQTTVVSNTGQGDLVVSSVARCNGTSAEFVASPASFTVLPGGSATVTVTYAPVDATTDGGCIAIASNDTAAGTQNVGVSGTGQAAPAAVADLDISRFTVAKRLDISRGGTTSPKVAVVNAGTIAIAPGDVTITVEGKDAAGVAVYTAADNTVAVLPGATAKVAFPVFTPSVASVVTWTVTLADANPDVDVATATTKVVP